MRTQTSTPGAGHETRKESHVKTAAEETGVAAAVSSVEDSRARADDDAPSLEVAGRNRVVIEGVRPEIDDGRFPIKRVVGERVTVEADVFADGHDFVAAALRYRVGKTAWQEVAMQPLVN